MGQRHLHHLTVFVVGERELLREIRGDAQPVRASVDHEIQAPRPAVEIKRALGIKDRRHDREHSPVGGPLRGHREVEAPKAATEAGSIGAPWRTKSRATGICAKAPRPKVD
jgi:hypothetical protein